MLLSPEVSRANKAPMFVSLVFKVMACNSIHVTMRVNTAAMFSCSPPNPSCRRSGLLLQLNQISI